MHSHIVATKVPIAAPLTPSSGNGKSVHRFVNIWKMVPFKYSLIASEPKIRPTFN